GWTAVPVSAHPATPATLTFHFTACTGPSGTPAAFDAVKQPSSAAALHLVDGSGIFVAVSAVDVASGATLFATPGFQHNAVATVACRLIHPVSGTLQAVVGMLAPDH
ncbi:MAG TPA: hypothetical protein VIU37_04915, partial [Candidatus Limnocylindrales bacterium]